jgi:hypothetical protein
LGLTGYVAKRTKIAAEQYQSDLSGGEGQREITP